MVSNDKSICQNCGSKLKRYDKVSRIVRTKGGKTSWIEIERFRCPVCGQIHRELPDYVFPYKQYEAEVIRGVLTTPFVKNKTKGEKIMSKEERHLQTKIRMFEDILLRTKNPSQVDNIQMELTRMRAKLQKLYFKRMES